MLLARKNAQVVLACRSAARGTAAVKRINAAVGRTAASYVHLDLCSLEVRSSLGGGGGGAAGSSSSLFLRLRFSHTGL